MTNSPFSDLLVIETASVLAGPSVGMFFAELGARVIKLENARTGGDVTRKWKLPQEDATNTVSAYFSSVNHRKEHRFVDLGSTDGHMQLEGLLAEADVLITNHLAEDAGKLGLERERLRSQFPRLLQGHIRGYAHDVGRPAYDVVLQAESGFISMTGTDEDHLAKLPIALIDVIAAHQLKEGLLIALLQRQFTGKGAYVEVSLEAAALTALINQASNYLMTGVVARPIGTLHPNIAPYGELFTCADGEHIVLAVGSNAQFHGLCKVLGLEPILLDPRFTSNPDRVIHRNALADLLQGRIAQQPRTGLLTLLQAEQVPAGAVHRIDQALASKQARSMVREEIIAGVTTKRITGNAFTIESY